MPTLICKNEDDERDVLITLQELYHEACSDLVCDVPWVGFNIRTFDGPYMEVRALLLEIPSFNLDLRKYQSKNVVDLMAELTFNGDCGHAVMSRGQKALAARLGINIEDETDGSMVADFVKAGNWDAIAAHCAADVAALTEMFKRRHDGPGFMLDLETAAIEDLSPYKRFVKPDGRLTDLKKIEADVESKMGKAALDPWLGRIVCVGYAVVE